MPAFLLALALLSVFFPVQARADDDPAVLMVKHAVFTGWQLGDGKVKSLYAKRSGTDKAGKALFTGAELREGMIYRHDVGYSDGSGDANGFTGSLFWETHDNGFITPVNVDSVHYRLAFDALMAEGTPQLPATSNGTGTIDGKPYDIVNVTMEGASPMNLWIDPATGAYGRVVIDPGGDYETTLDKITYATVGGKKFVNSFTYDDGETVTLSDFKPNAVISLADLHPPAPTATWTFANANPMKIRVTQHAIYFDASINGVKGRFILDTGADAILVTRAFAGRINAKPYSHVQFNGIGGGGPVKSDLLKADTVEIGGNTLSNVIIATSKAEFSNEDEVPDGVIGFPFLGGAVVEVNTGAQTMSVHDPNSSLDPYGGVVVTPDLSDGTPVVPMRMNDSVNVSATLDMGDDFYVLFSHDLITKHGLKFLIDRSSYSSEMGMSGIAGIEVDECGNIDSLAMGQIVYSPAPACTSNSYHDRDVLVGFDFLKNFDFVFAYPQGKIVMTPHKQ